MNLFCFSLEGSMDSLYEAVQESCEAQVYTIPSRSQSPAVLLDDTTNWKSAARSISMEISQINSDNTRKKKQRSLPKSVSENDALVNTICTNSGWPAAKKQEDLVLLRNHQNEDKVRGVRRAESQKIEDRKTNSRNIQQEMPVQIVYYEGCNPNQLSSRQNDLPETENAEMTRGTRVKKLERKSSQRGTPTQEITDGSRVMETARSSRHRWSNPTETSVNWFQAYNTCQPPQNEHCVPTCDCATSRIPSQGEKVNVQNMKRDSLPKGVVRSTTSVDFCAPNGDSTKSETNQKTQIK